MPGAGEILQKLPQTCPNWEISHAKNSLRINVPTVSLPPEAAKSLADYAKRRMCPADKVPTLYYANGLGKYLVDKGMMLILATLFWGVFVFPPMLTHDSLTPISALYSFLLAVWAIIIAMLAVIHRLHPTSDFMKRAVNPYFLRRCLEQKGLMLKLKMTSADKDNLQLKANCRYLGMMNVPLIPDSTHSLTLQIEQVQPASDSETCYLLFVTSAQAVDPLPEIKSQFRNYALVFNTREEAQTMALLLRSALQR